MIEERSAFPPTRIMIKIRREIVIPSAGDGIGLSPWLLKSENECPAKEAERKFILGCVTFAMLALQPLGDVLFIPFDSFYNLPHPVVDAEGDCCLQLFSCE